MADLLQYELEVANMTINADGVPNPWGKVFNQQYPGPWIGKFFIPAVVLSPADISFF